MYSIYKLKLRSQAAVIKCLTLLNPFIMATKRTMPRIRRRQWSVKDVQFLVNNLHLSTESIAKHLNRTTHAVENKLHKMRKMHNISTRAEAVMAEAMSNRNAEPVEEAVEQEGFFFEENVREEKQLRIPDAEPVLDKTPAGKSTTYEISWAGGSMSVRGTRLKIDDESGVLSIALCSHE